MFCSGALIFTRTFPLCKLQATGLEMEDAELGRPERDVFATGELPPAMRRAQEAKREALIRDEQEYDRDEDDDDGDLEELDQDELLRMIQSGELTADELEDSDVSAVEYLQSLEDFDDSAQMYDKTKDDVRTIVLPDAVGGPTDKQAQTENETQSHRAPVAFSVNDGDEDTLDLGDGRVVSVKDLLEAENEVEFSFVERETKKS